MKKLLHLFWCGIATLLLVSCATVRDKDLFPQKRVKYQHEAGTAHLAVLSQIPFNEYQDKMQPSFSINAEEALNKALIDASTLQDQVRKAQTAGLTVALPTTSVSEVTTVNEYPDGATLPEGTVEGTVTQEVTTRNEGRDAATVASTQPTITLSPEALAPPSATAISHNANLHYLTAAAVHQEVQMLNTYVKSAAIQPNYVPYIVRLQVGIKPRARNMPYDADTLLTFFLNVDGESIAPGVNEAVGTYNLLEIENKSNRETVNEFAQKLMNVDASTFKGYKSVIDSIESELVRKQDGEYEKVLKSLKKLAEDASAQVQASIEIAENPIKVIPLFVTDSIDASLATRSYDETAQFALELAGTLQGIGVGGNYSNLVSRLQSFLSRDYNSLYTVSRVSDNALSVRFGAMRSGPNQYTMMTRTHNVTFLMLVPEAAFTLKKTGVLVDVFSSTRYTDAKEGEELSDYPSDLSDERLKAIIDGLGVKELTKNLFSEENGDKRKKLIGKVYQNKREEFNRILLDINKENPYGQSLVWNAILRARIDSPYSTAQIPVSNKKKFPYALKKTVVECIDDGAASQVSVGWGMDLAALPIYSIMKVDGKELSGDVKVSTDQHSMIISFPSMQKLYPTDAKEKMENATLSLFYLDDEGGKLKPLTVFDESEGYSENGDINYTQTKPKPKQPADKAWYSLVTESGVNRLKIEKGKATMNLYLIAADGFDSTKATISVTGGASLHSERLKYDPKTKSYMLFTPAGQKALKSGDSFFVEFSNISTGDSAELEPSYNKKVQKQGKSLKVVFN